jgi:hypothetical protein
MTYSVADKDVRPLVYRCPRTGIDIITHVLARLGHPIGYLSATPFGLKCPCCGTNHIFSANGCRSFSNEPSLKFQPATYPER